MSEEVWILGINMTKFGKHPDKDSVDLAAEASLAALADAGVGMKQMDILAAGNLLGGGHLGQTLQKQIGQTGIPVYNVANACATGATALRTAVMAVKAGEADYGLAVGVEKLAGAGLLAGGARKDDGNTWTPAGRYGAVAAVDGRVGTEIMPGVFAQIGMEYLNEHPYEGSNFELFARISEKNHAHSTLNPLAAYTKRMSLEEIMNDVMIAYPNTRPMCSANCNAAKQAFEQAGVGPEDLDLVELHDCFATAELVHYDNLMLCEPGGAVEFFESGATWRDGTTPVNVSGGLESKGHPIAATGIANVWEVCHHLRGEAGDRQIEGAKVGLAHVIGLGSACGIHILEKAA